MQMARISLKGQFFKCVKIRPRQGNHVKVKVIQKDVMQITARQLQRTKDGHANG